MKHKIHFKYHNFNFVIEETISLYTDIDYIIIHKFICSIAQIMVGAYGELVIIFDYSKANNIAKYISDSFNISFNLRLKYPIANNSYPNTVIDPLL